MAFVHIPDEFPNLDGQVVIVTGGSSGIGLAMARLYHANGASVTIADLAPPPTTLLSPSSRWRYHKTDVTSWPDLVSLFGSTFTLNNNRLDILLANAGVGEVEDLFLDELDDAGLLKEPKYTVLDVNLRGVLSCIKLAVHYFAKDSNNNGGGGKIVMTGSTASYLNERIPIYQAAKHGLVGLMRGMRSTSPKFNITINMVAPFMTESALMTPQLRSILRENGLPINDPLSVAKAVAFLCTKGWNGKTIMVIGDRFAELESLKASNILKVKVDGEVYISIEKPK